jgi:hypothetical protein
MPRLSMKKMKKMNKKSVRRSKTAKGGKRRKSKRTLRGGAAEDEGAATQRYKTAEEKLKRGFGLSGGTITGIYFNDILFMGNDSLSGAAGYEKNEFFHYNPIETTEGILIRLARTITSHYGGVTSVIYDNFLIQKSNNGFVGKKGIYLKKILTNNDPYVLGFNTVIYTLPALFGGNIPEGNYVVCYYVIETPVINNPLRLTPINDLDTVERELPAPSDSIKVSSNPETRKPPSGFPKPPWFYKESGTTLNKI